MSIYDLIDENDTPLVITAPYDEVHAKGLWHRGVHIVLYTSAGDVVIQKRAAGLPTYPDVFEISVGGGVDAGEEPAHAAIREVREELAIGLAPHDLEFIGKYRSDDTVGSYINHSVDYCYKALIPEATAFAVDLNETQSARLVPMKTIRDAMKNGGRGDFGVLAARDDLWEMLLSSIQ